MLKHKILILYTIPIVCLLSLKSFNILNIYILFVAFLLNVASVICETQVAMTHIIDSFYEGSSGCKGLQFGRSEQFKHHTVFVGIHFYHVTNFPRFKINTQVFFVIYGTSKTPLGNSKIFFQ